MAPPHITLTAIFRGFLPFICLQLCALAAYDGVQNCPLVILFTRLCFHNGELLQRLVHDADREALFALRLCEPAGFKIRVLLVLLVLRFHLLLYRREPVGKKYG